MIDGEEMCNITNDTCQYLGMCKHCPIYNGEFLDFNDTIF